MVAGLLIVKICRTNHLESQHLLQMTRYCFYSRAFGYSFLKGNLNLQASFLGHISIEKTKYSNGTQIHVRRVSTEMEMAEIPMQTIGRK